MSVRFEVEDVLRTRGGVYVLARLLDEADFRVGTGTLLGGVQIREYLDQPRALDAEGRQRSDLFSFLLVNAKDAGRFREGTIVALAHAAGR